MLGVKLRTAQAAGEAVTLEDEEELGEELPAKKAAKYYAGNVNSLRVRFKLSILPMLALLWVSLGPARLRRAGQRPGASPAWPAWSCSWPS